MKKLLTPFEVLDALRGLITGDYLRDLMRLECQNKTCDRKVYHEAYQLHSQP